MSRRGRRRWEARLRRAWRGRPPAALRVGEAAFGLAVDLRRFAYDAGLARARRGPIPVVSVGGLTVGGSGKTPLAAELGLWLGARGHRVAIVTHGLADEMAVHRRLNPTARVLGGRELGRAVREAARQGSEIAVLDDGFQHLRLARDLQLVLLDADAVCRTNRRRLPAGPFRERIGELWRADLCLIVRRSRSAEPSERLEDWLRRRLPAGRRARCALHPAGLEPANAAARAATRPSPTLSVAGVMKPEVFHERLVEVAPEVTAREVLPDHGEPGPTELERWAERAGARGIVTTLKDAVKLERRLPAETPIWYVRDRIAWESGREVVEELLLGVLEPPEPVAPSEGDWRR